MSNYPFEPFGKDTAIGKTVNGIMEFIQKFTIIFLQNALFSIMKPALQKYAAVFP
jgi:hypothetical protein